MNQLATDNDASTENDMPPLVASQGIEQTFVYLAAGLGIALFFALMVLGMSRVQDRSPGQRNLAPRVEPRDLNDPAEARPDIGGDVS